MKNFETAIIIGGGGGGGEEREEEENQFKNVLPLGWKWTEDI